MRPVLIELGPIVIRYYGLMYVIAFTVGLYLSWVGVRARRLEKVRTERARERSLRSVLSILEERSVGPFRGRVIRRVRASVNAPETFGDVAIEALESALQSEAELTRERAARLIREALERTDTNAAGGLVDILSEEVYRRWNLVRLFPGTVGIDLDDVDREALERAAAAIDGGLVEYLRNRWRYRWKMAEIADLRRVVVASLRDAFGVTTGGDVLPEADLRSLAGAIARQVLFVWDDAVDLLLWTIPCAILGARIYYVVLRWDVYAGNPIDVIKIWEGGLAIHGGVLAGALTVYLFARWKKVSFWALTDALVPSLILGQAIGRIGNLMNGDAFGTPTTLPWGIRFPEDSPAGMVYPGQATHPSMIYEMILNLMIFVYLWAIRRRGYKDGFSTAMYFILYAIARSIVSFTRGDSLWLGPIRAAHVISFVFVVGFGLLIWRRRLYRRATSTA